MSQEEEGEREETTMNVMRQGEEVNVMEEGVQVNVMRQGTVGQDEHIFNI